MARKKKALRILYPEEQHYACRDCPARCCRTPWGIPVAPEVAHVALQDPELRTRLVGRAPGVLAGGTLPMVEKDRQLQCVFLEDDLLCGLQKRHGHEALPRACQAYPFGFIQNDRGEEIALLSRHCPSIRDNRGEPLTGQIEAKLEQAGSRTLAPRMGLPSGRTLETKSYLALADAGRQLLLDRDVLNGVLGLYLFIERFDQALLPGSTPAASAETLTRARTSLEAAPFVPLASHPRTSFQARLFYAHLLGNLSYPSRVLTEFSVRRPTVGQRLGSWANKLAWLFEVGSVDLLHVGGRVKPGRVQKVSPFLSGPGGELVRDYLLEVIERRQLFVQQTYLTRAAVDLGLSVALVSRFARASAQGQGRAQVERADILEAIGIADLLLAHQADAAQSGILANLRLQFMSDEAAFRRFLASEAG